MAVDIQELNDEALADMTMRWLHEALPAGWIEAVDSGDVDAQMALRAGLDYSEWCIRFGEAGYATPTWPAEYGAGLSLAPGAGANRSTTC